MRAIIMTAVVLMLAGCTESKKDLPPTELPARPASATLPCETLTDAEMIQCIQTPESREICRKLDTTCARYKNLQSFVARTWEARDKK